MTGTGFFPLGREEATDHADELFLVGTSEVALVSLHADETLDASRLPIRYAGLSSCFRREAGAHGKDTRGLYRVHQFTKVEQVVLSPGRGGGRERALRAPRNAEAILEALEIPYRVALACTGEIGLGQTRKHEVECGCQDAGPTPRRTRARPWGISRRGDPTSDSEWRTARSDILTR